MGKNIYQGKYWDIELTKRYSGSMLITWQKEGEVAQLFLTLCDPWTVAYQTPPWNFSGKNTGVGCHFILQKIFPDPGIDPLSFASPASPALAGGFFPTMPPGKPPKKCLLKKLHLFLPRSLHSSFLSIAINHPLGAKGGF